jgi:SAM-dependent methyltransferase
MKRWLFDPSMLEHRSVYESIRSAQELLKGRILDLGAGEQPYRVLAEGHGNQYVALDVTFSEPKRPDVCADSLRLPFKDNSFDTVLCTQVAEHVKNPFLMFAEASRVLTQGGWLILTAPQAWPLHEEPYDFFRYTKYGLALLAEQAGLEVVTIRERHGALVALGQIFAISVYERFRKNAITRIPAKMFLIPFSYLCSLLDRIWFNPKFTMGYLLIATKRTQ